MNDIDFYIHDLYHTLKMIRKVITNHIALNSPDDDQLAALKEVNGHLLECLNATETWNDLDKHETSLA